MDANTIALFFKGSSDIIKSFYVLLNNPENGIIHPNSHTNKRTRNPKIPYSKATANSEAIERSLQKEEVHVPYKCNECGDYHIGHGNKIGPSLVLAFSALTELTQTAADIFNFKKLTIIPYD